MSLNDSFTDLELVLISYKALLNPLPTSSANNLPKLTLSYCLAISCTVLYHPSANFSQGDKLLLRIAFNLSFSVLNCSLMLSNDTLSKLPNSPSTC